MIKKILRNVYHFVFHKGKNVTGVKYWQKRAEQYGKRSVYNMGHPEDELETVTKMQKEILFPILAKELKGNEEMILDFGCGPGRFTHDLAEQIKGKAIGVDPIADLLGLAPSYPLVEYRVMKEGIIPAPDGSMDVVWICVVLGGITDEGVLRRTISEIQRVLKNNGLIFLVENTTEQPNRPHWHYRTVETYRRLFAFAGLRYVSDYFDLDERLSILAGRKNGSFSS
jgi:ubiquinone/menaquinone biosynthesis C-methylase UbiE